MIITKTKKIKKNVSNVSVPEVYEGTLAMDIAGNLVPVREVVRHRQVSFTTYIDSLMDPAELIDRLLDNVHFIRAAIRDFLKVALVSTDFDYAVFVVEHLATLLRQLLYEGLGDAYI